MGQTILSVHRESEDRGDEARSRERIVPGHEPGERCLTRSSREKPIDPGAG